MRCYCYGVLLDRNTSHSVRCVFPRGICTLPRTHSTVLGTTLHFFRITAYEVTALYRKDGGLSYSTRDGRYSTVFVTRARTLVRCTVLVQLPPHVPNFLASRLKSPYAVQIILQHMIGQTIPCHHEQYEYSTPVSLARALHRAPAKSRLVDSSTARLAVFVPQRFIVAGLAWHMVRQQLLEVSWRDRGCLSRGETNHQPSNPVGRACSRQARQACE